MMVSTYSIIVRGKVQGVFFRQSTKEKADELGITGRVMNHSDGSVHIIANGTKEQIDQLKEWCHQGPPGAKVESVKMEEAARQEFRSFTIQRS
jgi:acylphosphatase